MKTLILAFALLLSKANSATYTITDLGAYTMANGINNLGQVVGTNGYGSGPSKAFLYQNGNITNLGTLGGVHAYATDINDNGQVAGYSETPSDFKHPYIWQNGVMTDLAPTSSGNYITTKININGQVVGYNGQNGFMWDQGATLNLQPLTNALGINNFGQIVGTAPYIPGNGSDRAFLWQSGVTINLSTTGPSTARDINNFGQIVGNSRDFGAIYWPNVSGSENYFIGPNSGVNAINDIGEIVGFTNYPANNGRAFVWKNGVLVDLNLVTDGLPSDIILTNARDINNFGQIIVEASNTHSYLLTPIPEPFTLGLLLFSFILFLRRRR